MATMLDYATAALDAGLCVMPPKGNGSKAPRFAWKSHQDEPTTIEQVNEWYDDDTQTGIGAILGKASQMVELLEFDEFETHETYRALAHEAGFGDLIERIEAGYCEETPNGVHWLYRCEVVEGNTKLAQRPKRDDEREHPNDNIKVLIETRGEGGYVVLAPTHGDVHPTHKPYTQRSGSYATIQEITPIEREQLFSLARALDAMPRNEHVEAKPSQPRLPGDAERPGDYYNRTRTWADVLSPHGWREHFTRGGETYWTRPGRERVISATTNYADSDLLKVFSTSTEFDTTRTYSKFGAHALLNYGGSFADAARAIRAEMPRQALDLIPSRNDAPANGNHSSPLVMTDAFNELAAHLPATLDHEGEPDYWRLKSRLFTTEQLFELPPPEWLIEGILPKDSLAVLWGQSGSYKSFLALDWALCLATGSWWKKRPIGDPVSVLYVVAEGASGIPKRVRSWSKDNSLKKFDRMWWLPESVDILNDREYNALCRLVVDTEPSFMVIDTLARSMPGADENSAQDMGRLIERADRLKKLSNGTVLLIHHSTKEGSVARGSGALRNAVDTEMEVKHDGTTTIVYCRKQKDAAEFDPIMLHLVVVDDSCVLSTVSGNHETVGQVSHAFETVKCLYRETFSETVVSGAQLRTVIEQTVPCSRAQAYRLINDLLLSGFIRNVATGKYPMYDNGPDYYEGSLSHRLTSVSDRLIDSDKVSHPLGGSIEPQDETVSGSDLIHTDRWTDR